MLELLNLLSEMKIELVNALNEEVILFKEIQEIDALYDSDVAEIKKNYAKLMLDLTSAKVESLITAYRQLKEMIEKEQ